MTAHFHPQRLLPRYSGLVSKVSRLPGGLPMAMRVLSPVVNSHEPSATENPTPLDLELARIVVCGFPRTGTTFLQTAIQDAFEDSTACWKNHDVLSIPRYLKAGIPTVVTLRDPLQTAISWSIYNNDRADASLLAHRLTTYALWHEQVRDYLHSRLLRLKRFDDFRDHPFETMSPVLREIAREDELHHVDAEFVEHDLELRNFEQGISVSQGNLPSARRRGESQKYVDLTSQRQVRVALERADESYLELHDRSLRRPRLDMIDLSVAERDSSHGSRAGMWAGTVATGSLGALALLRLFGD